MADTQPQDEGWVPLDSFAARLVLLRRELRLTQAEAAAQCDLDDGSWSNWENGTRPRGMDSIVGKIAKTFGVDRDWLMWGTTARDLRHPDSGCTQDLLNSDIAPTDENPRYAHVA